MGHNHIAVYCDWPVEESQLPAATEATATATAVLATTNVARSSKDLVGFGSSCWPMSPESTCCVLKA